MHNVETMRTDSFEKNGYVVAQEVGYLLKLVIWMDLQATENVYEIMEMSDYRSKLLKKSMFAKNAKPNRKEV